MMKSALAPLFASVLLASVAACSTPADTDETGGTTTAAVETQLYAEIEGASSGPIYRETKADTLAVSGFDVVSYFTGEGVPVEGLKEFTVRYEGYDYRFASEENAKTFIADPAQYAPAYGGYCAWAIGANDGLAPGDPNVYEIVDGTLYLNYNKDVQRKWQADVPGFIAKADVNYPTHSADEHYQD